MNEIVYKLIESWKNCEGTVNSNSEILDWITKLNKNTYVNIKECSIGDSDFWFYDDYNGEISNTKKSFFSIKGIRRFIDNKFINEQPIIIQPEIGYLGIICKEINGVINFLMQAKIEPGNINCVQISPTIQATRSNFNRVHGGKLPLYFNYFEQSYKYPIIYDQIQSEQGSRFFRKRNRNILLLINEDIIVEENFMWMTLGQIKKLMCIDNLVNMDTRTVISGIPIASVSFEKQDQEKIKNLVDDDNFYNSMFHVDTAEELSHIYNKINNYKMFVDYKETLIPLNELVDWNITEKGIHCEKTSDFSVNFYDISISGREVQHWTQPLFKAKDSALFVLFTKVINGERKFLVSLQNEIGYFDLIELGPSIQREASHMIESNKIIEQILKKCLEENSGILYDVMLSEEGGRFYQEQNRNLIIDISKYEDFVCSEELLWVSYRTLNYLIQVNNCVNIQLRNLLSLIKI